MTNAKSLIGTMLVLIAHASGARAQTLMERKADLKKAEDTILTAECAEARTKITTGEFPRDRLEAARKLESCLAQWRVLLASWPEGSERNNLAAVAHELEKAQRDGAAKASAETDFMGMTFGLGVGFSCYEREVVSEAVLDGSKLVAKDKKKCVPRVILESHSYGLCNLLRGCKSGNWGIGPYFGIVTDGVRAISGFSGGVMAGWKDASPDSSTRGFSVGVGAILDAGVSSWPHGWRDGSNIPAGETAVRFVKRDTWSWILLTSRTF